MFSVEDYYKSPLSTWMPSASLANSRQADHASTTEMTDTSHSVFKLVDPWRSAAMDCVDVLHWAANGTVARLAGAEHATVLHLQFSRVVLWSPYAAIRTIAEWAAVAAETLGGHKGQRLGRTEVARHESTVIQWAQRDEVR